MNRYKKLRTNRLVNQQFSAQDTNSACTDTEVGPQMSYNTITLLLYCVP